MGLSVVGEEAEEGSWTTRMVVAVAFRGSGDLESIRLNRFVEVLRKMRVGLRRTTLRRLSLSPAAAGEEAVLPMATGSRGTGVLVAQGSV